MINICSYKKADKNSVKFMQVGEENGCIEHIVDTPPFSQHKQLVSKLY